MELGGELQSCGKALGVRGAVGFPGEEREARVGGRSCTGAKRGAQERVWTHRGRGQCASLGREGEGGRHWSQAREVWRFMVSSVYFLSKREAEVAC